MTVLPVPPLNIPAYQIEEFLQIKEGRACALASLFNKIFPVYHINTLPRVQMTLAQLAHESISFSHYVESLNYSAAGLARTWPFRFAINPKAAVKLPNEKAKAIEHKEYTIATEVYNGRNGNNMDSDGWDFRGSGAVQITGKENVAAYAHFKGFSSVYDTARLMRESDEYAIDSACWFLSEFKSLLPYMDEGNLNLVTKAINGGLIGIDERKKLFERAKIHVTKI